MVVSRVRRRVPAAGPWVRWDCLHGDSAYHRASVCARLAQYLYDGIGGPREPALAVALFDRQCNAPDDYRMSDAVLYGAGGSVIPCTDARAVVVRDDRTGRRGAFELTGRLQ